MVPAYSRSMILRLFALILALLPVAGAQAATNHIAVSIESETMRPAPGSRVAIALVMKPEHDWHGYWENPGDAGIPTSVEWRLPPGASVVGLRHPVPGRLVVQGLMNYIYERPYALLASLTIPANARPGAPIRVEGEVNWLACSPSTCVPEHGKVAIDLVAGDGAVDPAARARFDKWRAKMPRPLAQPASFERKGDLVRIAIPFPQGRPVADPYFFPAVDGVIDYAAPQAISRNGDRLIVEVKAAIAAKPVKELTGVLAIGTDQGLSLVARPGRVAAAGAAIAASDGSAKGAGLATTFLLALGGAILGGLLLNIMPCVFPILSLKALSLARQGETARHARSEAIAYAGGVILSCVALGGALLALRAGGATVGWAFQLQDPRVILLLLLLVVAISLNLAGLIELGTIGVGEGLTKGEGLAPSFWTGVLAAFVATPCTGPFMAGALGVALILPTVAAIAIFAGLGLGLALPFLLIGFVPALRRRLPKPGAWMNRLRHILSVPMFATALGLAWILGRQAGVDGMSLGLAAAVLLGLGLWWVGSRQYAGRRFAWAPAVPLVAVALAVAAVVPRAAPASAAVGTEGTEAFSEARLAALTAQGKPVFVYFTADWCLTCKVNEKTAIERPEVREAFVAKGVVTLVGDWTDGDPAIGRFLEAQGRSGVPLYLFYKPGAPVEVLPQLLTPGALAALAA
jgi:thiol:disulfide interchange protein